METKKVKVFIHSNKDEMYETGKKLGLTGQALAKFKYALMEIPVDIEVNPLDGSYVIKRVDGKKVHENV